MIYLKQLLFTPLFLLLIAKAPLQAAHPYGPPYQCAAESQTPVDKRESHIIILPSSYEVASQELALIIVSDSPTNGHTETATAGTKLLYSTDKQNSHPATSTLLLSETPSNSSGKKTTTPKLPEINEDDEYRLPNINVITSSNQVNVSQPNTPFGSTPSCNNSPGTGSNTALSLAREDGQNRPSHIHQRSKSISTIPVLQLAAISAAPNASISIPANNSTPGRLRSFSVPTVKKTKEELEEMRSNPLQEHLSKLHPSALKGQRANWGVKEDIDPDDGIPLWKGSFPLAILQQSYSPGAENKEVEESPSELAPVIIETLDFMQHSHKRSCKCLCHIL